MKTRNYLMYATAAAALMSSAAQAESFNISGGDLESALSAYSAQTGIELIVSDEAIRGIRTSGVKGELPPGEALSRILTGTGFIGEKHSGGTIAVVKGRSSDASELVQPLQLAQAAPARAAVETVTVTSSKLGGADVQSIPIAITALSQEQLTSTQTAGGPDLVRQVPNLNFTKTNFSGYSIQIRGIGTQAISVTTDPAVAVAFNDVPFIRNHFFEQEFYDAAQVEVLRGPQGTLYGRNATAGVVNLTSAKPTDQFEAMASGEFGNYKDRRFEGMINIPVLDDRFDVRLAGEWTKRDGYSFNALTDNRIDGRDLWSARLSIGWKPLENLQTNFVWEHFQEDDDRLRSAKQLCKPSPLPTSVGGVPTKPVPASGFIGDNITIFLAQGCEQTSLYSPDAFGVPNGYTLPYYSGLTFFNLVNGKDPYANSTQSPNLRVIESQIEPTYKAKNNVLEFNADYEISPALTFTSQSAYNQDFLWSTEDYNRFQAASGVFTPGLGANAPGGGYDATLTNAQGVFCDPQLGCSDHILAEDLNESHAWQASQELRLASHFSGPFNFSIGGNYLHYETEENYYVFINSLTIFSYWDAIRRVGQPSSDVGAGRLPWVPGVSDNSQCLFYYGGFKDQDPTKGGGSVGNGNCAYIDPNPIGSLNMLGHNYFLSQNPYNLNSYASFGEAYYNITPDLKFTGGLRWTEDQKHFVNLPSELLTVGVGYPSTGTVNQQWDAITGRAAMNWTPKLNFTDQTLLFGSYAHGYKAGGANPPGAVLLVQIEGRDNPSPIHPLTFKPEYIDAFELGTKNTLLDGSLTLNGSIFYYNYEGYQISEIVDRTAINNNFDAHVKGAEFEATWEPIPGLRFNASGGYEDARVANGEKAVDLMDRTAGNPDWIVVKPFLTQASNCILPTYVVAAMIKAPYTGSTSSPNPATYACGAAYFAGLDPMTGRTYQEDPTGTSSFDNRVNIPAGYPGFDPLSVDPNAPANVNNGLGLPPNSGQGFDKDLSHHMLPNAPPFTFSAGAQYSVPITSNWAGTMRADFYWQDDSWARIFNDNPYDRLHGYTNLNLTLILTNQNGWQAMGFIKNVMNTTAITGAFLNSDDSGLTTNVFLTDPRLFGIRITKNW